MYAYRMLTVGVLIPMIMLTGTSPSVRADMPEPRRAVSINTVCLSPRLSIDGGIVIDPHAFSAELSPQILSDDTTIKNETLRNALINYALKRKEEHRVSGFIIYHLFKSEVDRIERRDQPYKLKNQAKKSVRQNINGLRKLLASRKEFLDKDEAREFEMKILALEQLLDKVQTYGDWDDLIEQGTRIRAAIAHHGAWIRGIQSLLGMGKPKKNPHGRRNVPTHIKPRIIKSAPDNPAPALPTETVDEAGVSGMEEDNQPALWTAPTRESNRASATHNAVWLKHAEASLRKHVLERALSKLLSAYGIAMRDLSHDNALEFSEKIAQLESEIRAAKRGQYPALKRALRSVETALIDATRQARQAQPRSLSATRPKSHKPRPVQNGSINHRTVAADLPAVSSNDPWVQAVGLADPEKNTPRLRDEIIDELSAQTGLLTEIIRIEQEQTVELRYTHTLLRANSIVLDLKYSEQIERIETGSDIVMVNDGNLYELRCVQIQNAGRSVVLVPVKSPGSDRRAAALPDDIRGAKFFYVPDVYSEDIQRTVIEEIIANLKGPEQSTGIPVLDYLLRLKPAPRDIEHHDALRKDIAFSQGLDQFQKAAVNMITATKFGLILGPFGTGKTRVLLSGAQNIVLNTKKPVFIIAPQHKIADDITLKAGATLMPVLRCGNNPYKFDPQVREQFSRHSDAALAEFIQRYHALNTGDGENGCLFVGTDMGTSFDWLIKELRKPESAAFLKDVTLIVDEAALINYPELVSAVYILRPDALFLVGDHVQFSPYKLAARFSRAMMRSFKELKALRRYHCSSFKELIAKPFNKVKLSINYRNPWISVDFLQRWYAGTVNLQSVSKTRGDFIYEDTVVIEDTSTWDKSTNEEWYPGTNSYANKSEALWILKRIKYFLAQGYAPDDIAVITFYHGQIRLISDFIDADGDITEADAAIIKRNMYTPIRFQGAEKKVILASLVRSRKEINPACVSGSVKRLDPLYLTEPEIAKSDALLVLLSRHSEKLNLIGNRRTLEALTENYPRIQEFYSALFSWTETIAALRDEQYRTLIQECERSVRMSCIESAI